MSESPYWKYKYFHGNMVVMFLANGDRREEANTNGFVYVGEPQVLTAEQYWREIREKTPAN
ncbi:MAG: hypothetical protein GWP08_19520 [Nitrospiraceae bacterium]|nr:hypothetical protein [Nitrospiraceae bacterium]